MKKYYIEDVQCGTHEIGYEESMIVSIRYKDENQTRWLNMEEVIGIPNVSLTEKDIFQKLMNRDIEDEHFLTYLQEHYIYDFCGIRFGSDYSETFESMSEDPENPAIPLIKYLILLVRERVSNEDDLVKMAIGKYADEINIPLSEVEEDFLGA